MGKITKGILGGFSGTVGTVVGASWRGIEYMRSRALQRKASNTAKQAAQRAKFKLAFRFLESMKDLLLIGYKNQAVYMTEQNSALSYTLKNAVTGIDPDFAILYPQVQISRGSLPNAVNPSAAAGAAGTIAYNWTDNSGTGKAQGTDQAILAAYSADLNQTMYVISPLRSAGTGTLNVPGFSGKVVQTWISFLTEDGMDIATSVFTGEVTVAS
jgi:hypothetical protein